MSEKKKIYNKYMDMALKELEELQDNCPHEETWNYSNHFIESSKCCKICGKVFDIKYSFKPRPDFKWNNLEF